MLSVVPGILILGVVAFAALQLSLHRPSPNEYAVQRAAASHVSALAIALQFGHFAEEYATGFYTRFPALFGMAPMPLRFFVAFNLAWIVIWIASVPLLAVTSGGYFPGLISSLLVGLVNVYLWQRLYAATSRAT